MNGSWLITKVNVENQDVMLEIMKHAYELGIVMDPFLFYPGAFRIAPPLVITDEEIHDACELLIQAMDAVKF